MEKVENESGKLYKYRKTNQKYKTMKVREKERKKRQ